MAVHGRDHPKTLHRRPNASKFANASDQPQEKPQEQGHGAYYDVLHFGSAITGIYLSFMTWSILQEKITTQAYGADGRIFRSPVVMNTCQSLFAAMTGFIYLRISNTKKVAIIPSRLVLAKLLLVAVTTSLASPFGYQALKHIDFITYILAKSCKLLPVMFLHLAIFQTRYPMYKYGVVAAVTLGVALFTIYHPVGSKHKGAQTNSVWGLSLLGVNLLFDGLTNSVQDHIMARHSNEVSGAQMMCTLNVLGTMLNLSYLLLYPGATELGDAIAFINEHPAVGWDIIQFAACGAVGQIFIFYTLATFGSIVLVTVTVTRKMFSMILSVLMYGHVLTSMQWLGVGLVFGGIGYEAEVKRRSTKQRLQAAR